MQLIPVILAAIAVVAAIFLGGKIYPPASGIVGFLQVVFLLSAAAAFLTGLHAYSWVKTRQERDENKRRSFYTLVPTPRPTWW